MDRGLEKPPNGGNKPSEDSLFHIRGDFVPVSPRTKARSSSPRRRAARQPINVRVNFTDEQMEKFTDALTSPRGLDHLPNRPARHHAHHSDPLTPSNNSGQAVHGLMSGFDKPLPESHPYHDASQTLSHAHLVEGIAPSFSYPRLRSLSPAKHLSPDRSQTTLAERRNHPPPSNLVFPNPQTVGNPTLPAPMSPVPQTPKRGLATTDYEWDSESVYSRDDKAEPCVGPLRIPPREDDSIEPIMGDNSILHGYCAWKQASPQLENITNPPALEHLNSEFPGHGSEAEKTESKLKSQQKALYSPLTPFFADKGGAADKKGSKMMFGQNGWLEKTGETPEKKKITQKKSMFGGLRKMAKDLTTSSRRPHAEGKKHLGLFSSISISLDPREQSLLYCELEFYLSCAIHGYITVQLNHGRLDADKLKKIADAWAHKGRPKVIGFRYDLETQIELIGLHMGEFRFYGRRQNSEVQISGLLHTMKVNARAMRIRTFCQPDSVMAKQLVDAQSFFNLLGVPDVQQVALQHVAQFFRVIVERERGRSMKRESDKSQAVSSLVDHQWEGGNASSVGQESRNAGSKHTGT